MGQTIWTGFLLTIGWFLSRVCISFIVGFMNALLYSVWPWYRKIIDAYPLEKGECSAWNRLISVLYSPEERRKIEWAIGSIVSGDSRRLQKFMMFYGAAGTGKSTIINVIQQLFEGYTSVFDAKALGSASNSFALEAFKSNPLVAIQHDGDGKVKTGRSVLKR